MGFVSLANNLPARSIGRGMLVVLAVVTYRVSLFHASNTKSNAFVSNKIVLGEYLMGDRRLWVLDA